MKDKSIRTNAVLNGVKSFAQIIFPIITFPYITRVLGVVNIGKVNFANSIVGYFSLIAALGITNYAIREGASIRDNRERFKEFANQIFTINLVTTLLAYILLAGVMAVSKNLKDYEALIWIQSLNILLTTLGVEWIYSIYEDYLFITVRTVIVQFLSLVLLLFLVRETNDYVNYVWVSLFASGGANLLNILFVGKYCRLRPVRKVNIGKHIKPMLILGCNTIAITIYINSDITILRVLKNDYYVGIYSTAVKIYTVIKQVINAVMTVSIPRLSYLLAVEDRDGYNCLLEKILKSLLVLLFPTITGISMLGEEIVVLVSGKEYLASAGSLRILSLALGFAVLACFFTMAVLLPFKKEKYTLRATIISAITNIVLNFFLIPVWAEKGAAFTTLLSEFLVVVIAIGYSYKDFRVTGIKRTIKNCLIGCMGIALICILTKKYISQYVITLLFSILCSVLAYGVIMLRLKDEIVYGLWMELRGKINKKKRGML